MRRAPFQQLIVAGDPGRERTELGLALARSLHRPFFDAIDLGAAVAVGGVSEVDERGWLDRLLAVSDAAVIAVSATVVAAVSSAARERSCDGPAWILQMGPGPVDDSESWIDARAWSSMPVEPSEVDRLVREFRDASRNLD